MIYGSTIDIDGTPFDVLAEYGEYGYSWSVSAVLRDPDTQITYAANACGCSCNSFDDMVTEMSDLTRVGSVAEAVKVASENLGDDELVGFAERVNGIRHQLRAR